jgi:hypothetical protein
MSFDYKYYLKRYLNECIEAFVLLTILKFFDKVHIKTLPKFIYYILIIGLITLILEEINPDLQKGVKTGFIIKTGSSLIV